MAEEKIEQHEKEDKSEFAQLHERLKACEDKLGLNKKPMSQDEKMRQRKRS